MRFVSGKAIGLVATVLGLGLVGCGSDQPEATALASGTASGAKPVTAPQKKIPADVLKTFRAESCYFGALALAQAKESYMGSLAGAEPSEGKLPDFGLAPVEIPTKEPAPKASATPGTPEAALSAAAKAPPSTASGKPGPATAPKPPAPPAAPKPATPPAAASAKTGTSAAPVAAAPSGSARSPGIIPPGRPSQRALPYERFLRSCNVVTTLKEPASAEYDAYVKEFAEYALPLSKSLQEASTYYQKEEFKNDKFAKGKELHKAITEGFAKLDEKVKKLSELTDKFEKASPVDKAAFEDSQKLADQVVTDANALVRALLEAPINFDTVSAALAKLEASTAALKKYGEDNKDKKDPWASLVPAPAQQLVDAVKPIVEAKAAKPSKLVEVITVHSRVLETNHRSLTRRNASAVAAPRGSAISPKMLRPKVQKDHP